MLPDFRFEFRKIRAIRNAILRIQDFVSEFMKGGFIRVVVFLDFSATFNCVQHTRAHEKPMSIEIEDGAVAFIVGIWPQFNRFTRLL